MCVYVFFFFQAEDGIRDWSVTGVQTCALPILARGLREHKPGLHVAAVEPAESAVLSGQPSGSHKIEGIGIGFVPPLWQPRSEERRVGKECRSRGWGDQ